MAQPERSHNNDKHFNPHSDGHTNQDAYTCTCDCSPNQDSHHHTHARHVDTITDQDSHSHMVRYAYSNKHAGSGADPAIRLFFQPERNARDLYPTYSIRRLP